MRDMWEFCEMCEMFVIWAMLEVWEMWDISQRCVRCGSSRWVWYFHVTCRCPGAWSQVCLRRAQPQLRDRGRNLPGSRVSRQAGIVFEVWRLSLSPCPVLVRAWHCPPQHSLDHVYKEAPPFRSRPPSAAPLFWQGKGRPPSSQSSRWRAPLSYSSA